MGESLTGSHRGFLGYRQQGIELDAAAAAARGKLAKEELRRRQAKASLDRYLYHYQRWAANHTSLQKVLKDMADLESSELEKMATVVGITVVAELDFLIHAYEQIAECRRVLRWAYAYGYYLDPERDAKKRELFDCLQSDANSSLERLHKCAELERKELCSNGGDEAAIAKKFKEYREKLANLTSVTRRYFGNLVKAFETDLPEVFAVNF